MLAEFAFTPEVFDEASQPDIAAWRDQLRELGQRMFSSIAACPVMVSNLYGGSWEHEAERCTRKITDTNLRTLCQGLLTKARDTTVVRSSQGDWPADESMWAKEAVRSSQVEPIERIITTARTFDLIREEYPQVRSMSEVGDSSFWRDVSTDASPSLRISEQIRLIRKVCVHGEFVALISPHIRDSSDSELDFAIEFVRCASERPQGFASGEIEVHLEDAQTCGATVVESDSGILAAVAKRIGRVLKRGEHVTIVAWPKLLDRLVVAGIHTRKGDDYRVRSPRWGISMNHIARRADESHADLFTEWKLLKRDSLNRWFDRYCAPGVSGCVRRVVSG